MELIQLPGVHAGILHIGDPHSTSRRPGTRNDRNFMLTVIEKLEQVAEIANSRNLISIILGDLFDREDDTNPEMMTRLIRALNMFIEKPFVMAGNHDMSETSLTDDTALAILREAGVVSVIDQSGFFLVAQIDDGNEQKTIAVGGSPHGAFIPTDVASMLADSGIKADSVGWITHEDMAFDGAYPGAKEFFEIKGCDWVVNGHMHLTKKPVKSGRTIWHNPGNITRLSKDCADHVPSVWYMNVSGGMTQLPLRYVKDVFDAVKGSVVANKDGAMIDKTSAFVEMLKVCSIAAEGKTQDGSVLLEDIALVCAERKASVGAINILSALHGMAVA